MPKSTMANIDNNLTDKETRRETFSQLTAKAFHKSRYMKPIGEREPHGETKPDMRATLRETTATSKPTENRSERFHDRASATQHI